MSAEQEPDQITVKEAAGDVWSSIVEVNRVYWQTVRDLFAQPQNVIQAYVKRDKMSYVNPFKLLLSVTAAVVFVQSLSMPYLFDYYLQKGILQTQAQAQLPQQTTKLLDLTLKSLQWMPLIYTLVFVPLMAWISMFFFRTDTAKPYIVHLAYTAYAMAIFVLTLLINALLVVVLIFTWPPHINVLLALNSLYLLFGWYYFYYAARRFFALAGVWGRVRMLLFFPIALAASVVLLSILLQAVNMVWPVLPI